MRRPQATTAAAPRAGAARTSAAEKSLVHRIRAFQWSEPANRKCADCSERGPTYICLTFQTFVCQTCSGIHRSFGHKIKGISLSDWSIKELEALEAGGNTVAAQTWLARWTATQFPEPDSNQMDRLKEFMKRKYVDKAWWKQPQPKAAGDSESQDEQRLLRVPASPAGLRPTKDTKAEERAVPASAPNLLDSDGPATMFGLSPPPALAASAPLPADAKGEWTADFGSPALGPTPLDGPCAPCLGAPSAASAPGAAGGGLLDLDFGPASAPQVILAPVAGALGAFGVGALSGPPGSGVVQGMPPMEELPAAMLSAAPPAAADGQLADGLAGLDFGTPAAPAGAAFAPPLSLGGHGTSALGGGGAAADLLGVSFGCTAGPSPLLPAANAVAGFGASFCSTTTPYSFPHVESPLMEPAEEPAPVGAKEEPGNMGDRLRKAMLSSSGEVQQLFRECQEPPRRPAQEDRFAAFAAFDELSSSGSAHAKPEAAARPPSTCQQQMLFGIPPPGPPPGLGGHPSGLPPALGGFSASSADAQPFLGGMQMPKSPGSGQGLAASQPITALTTEQIGQLMPHHGMMAPQQLEHLNQQELMQMHLMVSQAMQARAQQQRPGAAPPAPQPSAQGLAGGPPAWQAAPHGPGAGAAGGAAWGAAPGAPAPQAAQREPSPPKEFGDLLAAFHARNPISGIELKA